jgi:hypothetical protein
VKPRGVSSAVVDLRCRLPERGPDGLEVETDGRVLVTGRECAREVGGRS